MSDYAKASLTVTYSENSDYSDYEFRTNWDAYTLSPDEGEVRSIEADTGGTTLELGTYASITLLAVKNTSSTNYVDAAWTDAASNTNTQRIPAGGLLVVSSVLPSADLGLTANSAAVICKVCLVGS